MYAIWVYFPLIPVGSGGRLCTMAKFRMKLKMQALELEIEGAREDASLINRNIGQQIAGLLQPVTDIIEGEVTVERATTLSTPAQALNGGSKKARRKRQGIPTSGEAESASAIDFVLSPERYGSPTQQWSTSDKTVWLLYVLDANQCGNEFSTRTIVETFNKHFKQSGTIKTGNVNRDLGRLKTVSKPPLVGENTTKTPSTWYLTDEGRKRAQALITDALGEAGKA